MSGPGVSPNKPNTRELCLQGAYTLYSTSKMMHCLFAVGSETAACGALARKHNPKPGCTFKCAVQPRHHTRQSCGTSPNSNAQYKRLTSTQEANRACKEAE
jgi:hypothetical protein